MHDITRTARRRSPYGPAWVAVALAALAASVGLGMVSGGDGDGFGLLALAALALAGVAGLLAWRAERPPPPPPYVRRPAALVEETPPDGVAGLDFRAPRPAEPEPEPEPVPAAGMPAAPVTVPDDETAPLFDATAARTPLPPPWSSGVTAAFRRVRPLALAAAPETPETAADGPGLEEAA